MESEEVINLTPGSLGWVTYSKILKRLKDNNK
jgi:hypothetical protein